MSLKFKDQFRGKKFYVLIVLLLSFATVSLKIIVMLTACTDSATCSETSLKDKILQNSLSKSMIPIRTFSAQQPQKLVNRFNLKASSANVAPEETNSKTVGSTGLERGCEISPANFKSWTRGKVTEVTPAIHANCTLLFKGGDEVETAHVSLASYTWPATKHALNFAKWVRECHCIHFKHEFVGNFYTAKEEVKFPLAFTMVVHNNPFQVFRLLKVLYRPHNIYCIHYDSKSSEDMKLLFKKLAKCFDNIITPSAIIEVEWGRHSLMEAQMNCFRDLLMYHSKYPWRYVITLCGKELPLRTNREIVQLLKQLKGTSAIRVTPLPEYEKPRYEKTWTLNRNTSKLVPTNDSAGPIPYNLTIYKSMIYFGLTPGFVNYTLNDEVAITLSRFLNYALIPEELFYSTLFMIPGTLYIKLKIIGSMHHTDTCMHVIA